MFKGVVLPLTLLAMVFGAVAMQYQAGIPLHAFLFNSDGMYLPTLFTDLFRHGGTIRDWYLTPAPYFFPDYLLYAVAYAAAQGAFGQFLVFGLLQLATAGVLIAWIARICLRAHAVIAAALVTAAWSVLAVHAIEPYVYALASAFHCGAFLAALAFIALWLQHDAQPRWSQLAGMCAVAFVTALSDALFVLQTVAPFLVTSALVRRRDAPFAWRAALPHMAVLASAALGNAAYRWVITHRTRPPAALGLDHVARNAHALGDAIAGLFQHVPLLGLMMGVYVLLGIACIVRVVQTGTFLHLPRPLLVLMVFSLVATVGNLTAMLLLTNLVVTLRYVIPALTWPLIVLTMLCACWKPAYFGRAGLALLAGLAVMMGLQAWDGAQRNEGERIAYPAQFACIDQALAVADAHHGIAAYWDAKRIQAVSRQDLAIAQISADLTEHRWITTARYFRPSYDFAIVNAESEPLYLLPQAQLIAHNGPPMHTALCGTYTVLIYGHDKLRVPERAIVD